MTGESMLEAIKKIARKVFGNDDEGYIDGISMGISVSDGCIGEKLMKFIKREEPC